MRVFYREIIYEKRETVNQKITQSDQITLNSCAAASVGAISIARWCGTIERSAR